LVSCGKKINTYVYQGSIDMVVMCTRDLICDAERRCRLMAQK
jgi:hypothetical protein